MHTYTSTPLHPDPTDYQTHTGTAQRAKALEKDPGLRPEYITLLVEQVTNFPVGVGSRGVGGWKRYFHSYVAIHTLLKKRHSSSRKTS